MNGEGPAAAKPAKPAHVRANEQTNKRAKPPGMELGCAALSRGAPHNGRGGRHSRGLLRTRSDRGEEMQLVEPNDRCDRPEPLPVLRLLHTAESEAESRKRARLWPTGKPSRAQPVMREAGKARLVHAPLCIRVLGGHEQRAVPEGTRPDLCPPTHNAEQRPRAEQRSDRRRLRTRPSATPACIALSGPRGSLARGERQGGTRRPRADGCERD